MYWSGVQSTGAEMRKYFTVANGQQLYHLSRVASLIDDHLFLSDLVALW